MFKKKPETIITIQTSNELKDWIKNEAKKQDRSMTNFLNQLLLKHKENHEKLKNIK